MAVLEKIRSVQWLLFVALILLGIGMLGFLIPYDAVLALFNQGGNRAVGEIGGASISATEYQMALQTRRDLFNYANNQSLESEVWNDMIEQYLLEDDYKALGLDLKQGEFDEIRFGDQISPYIQRTFYGQGVTPEQKDQWKQTFAGMFAQDPAKYEGYARVIKQKRLREKYDMLVNKGIYANSLEAKYEYLSGQEKVNIKYVLKKYTDIADSTITLSDSDVRGFYNRHKNDKQYVQLNSRDIEYINFPVAPSQADIDAINAELGTLAADWKVAADDSVFAASKSASGRYVVETVRQSESNTEMQKQMFSDSIGTIVGPYDENGFSKLVKLVDRKSVADSTAKCRHILLKSSGKNDPTEIATLNAKADSLKALLKGGASFEDLVNRFSDDPGSKATGGVYDFFPRGQMVKPFEDFCFDSKIGAIGNVETTYGVHLVEVLDQRWKVTEATIAVIDRQIKPSASTMKEIYRAASEFSINYSDYESFKIAADTMGYAIVEAKGIRPGATVLAGGLRNPFEVVNWSFKAEKGEISNPMSVDGGYVVAALTKVLQPGVPPFENVETQMRDAAMKEAKAKTYMKMMSEGADLAAVAAAVGETVKTAANVTLKNATITGSGTGQEPKVAGLAFAIPAGNMSTPIQGEAGVWVIAPEGAIQEAPAKDNFFEEQDQVTSRARGGVAARLFTAVKEGAELEDNREGQ
jgi:peptidyl-prolyl cis-trans isomerase D